MGLMKFQISACSDAVSPLKINCLADETSATKSNLLFNFNSAGYINVCYLLWIIKDKFRVRKGLICLTSPHFFNKKSKWHEKIFESRADSFIECFKSKDQQFLPIVPSYEKSNVFEKIYGDILNNTRPVYSRKIADISNKIYVITDTNHLQSIRRITDSFQSLYIVDGRHGAAAMHKMSKECYHEELKKDNRLLSMLIPSDQMKICFFKSIIIGNFNDSLLFKFLNRCFNIRELNKKPRGWNINNLPNANFYELSARKNLVSITEIQLFDKIIIKFQSCSMNTSQLYRYLLQISMVMFRVKAPCYLTEKA